MAVPKIKTTIPPYPAPPPTRSDPDNFRVRADQKVAHDVVVVEAINNFAGEANTLAEYLNNLLPKAYVGTSSSEITVGTGTITVVLNEDDRAFAKGFTVKLIYPSDPNINMTGYVLDVGEDNKTLTISVSTSSGTGTYSEWVVTVPVTGDAATFEGMDYDEAMALANILTYMGHGGAI